MRADERRPIPTNSTESKRKNWAKVKVCFSLNRTFIYRFGSHNDDVRIQSADPSRAARILKMSDPMRHLNDEADREREELSCRSMVGARDHTKLHKEIRAGDDAST